MQSVENVERRKSPNQITNLQSVLMSNKRLDIQKLKFLVEPIENGVSIDVEIRANVIFKDNQSD